MGKNNFDLVYTQRFSPEIGGSITWISEIFSRWEREFKLLTHDYFNSSGVKSASFSSCIEHKRDNLLSSSWSVLQGFPSYWRGFRELTKLAKDNPSTRIFCNHIIPEGLTAGALKLMGRASKIICFVHGEEILAYQSSRELMLLLKLISKKIDLFIVNSKNTENLLLATLPSLNQDKIKISHPCLSLDKYKLNQTKAQLREKYQLPHDAKILISVSRLTKRKNQRLVIESLPELLKIFPELLYCVVGSGEELASLQELVARLNLENTVKFFGEVSETQKIEFLNLVDLFVLPTKKLAQDIEGFGIVFLEAQACGLPVICGKTGGEAEAVQHGKSGVLIEGESISEFFEAVHFLLSDVSVYNDYSYAAREFAQKFSSDLAAQEIFRICESI